ncbi:respiratory nitrate reductase chaperone NarJ [Thermolongibacillus altinsuensis]|uniref:Respiratory nitrate reductase chaperone NarJ n=1 Tax=Thermolongibacillus altinsuensis TaxID=575256 RepID=A0A4R1QHM4_9BACL|nr:nitrate reductase molybdenum cofactor assembly chaperone [Thermolongibacillus altinsuensis]TCL53059.1 respiratory nitrate reductase chaperone NarJ [Thermolongibacillus altinsuensis]GMB07761.1 putative nitrate reductase molybdenum cofactor assembly chaperone NarJ [Thermolongibacillus altinsuensis]
MDYAHAQTVFQVISYLLSYPDEQWREGLDDCMDIIGDLPHRQIVQNTNKFIDYVKSVDPNELIESYVYTFDFGKKTNLYVTYMNTGEQRERGIELLELKQVYKAAGFEVTERELPDYLPLMLEFASQAEQTYVASIMQKYFNSISEIRRQLIAAESYYAILFDVLFMALEEIGVRKAAEGSV